MGFRDKQVSGDHFELDWTQTMLRSDGLDSSKPRSTKRQLQTQQSDPLKCPRCESTNTKFCYYNNYNKTQPRHYCKGCKRHWTKGGTLRNVPIGGGRKNKRVKRPNTAVVAATTIIGPVPISDNSYIRHKNIISDHKDVSFKPIDNERRDVLESYTDIEELKGQVSWDFNGLSGNMHQLSHHNHQNLGFSMLSSSFETNPNPILSSFSSLSGYNDIEKFENVENSTITTTRMVMPSSSSLIPSTSNFLESNYWNWNDIDTMVLADLNKPWEDPQFKP